MHAVAAKLGAKGDFYGAAGGSHEPFHLLDVRETGEWNGEHIPGATYTGRGCLERDVERLIPDATDAIVVYCAAGARSLLAARALKEMGYTNVSSLAGGLAAWKGAGLPVAKNQRVYQERVEY